MKRIPLFPALGLMCLVTLADVAAQMYRPGISLLAAWQDDEIVTGSTDPKKPDDKTPQETPRAEPFVSSGTEADILNRLQQRREALEQREKQLDLRESLLKAADQKVESRIEELKAIETRLKQSEGQGGETQSIKQLATLYEAMKPKDAARVFDRLDMGVLLPVAQAIPPRKLAEIIAAMTPQTAERLTVELARGPRPASPLPAVMPAATAPLLPGELPSIPPAKAP
jgi:flagellar motility protein MotE (MotC chaperone)